MGTSCACRSAMCSRVTCPFGVNLSRSSWLSRCCATAFQKPLPSADTLAAAAATWRSSRRVFIPFPLNEHPRTLAIGEQRRRGLNHPAMPRRGGTVSPPATCDRRVPGRPLLVDGALGIHQQRHDVLYLFDGQHLVRPEPRHVGACHVRLRIVDPLVHDLCFRFGIVAVLAVAEQARAQCAIAHLALRELMTGVAVAAVLTTGRVVRKAQAVARLRQLLALLPIAEKLAVGGIDDLPPLALHDGFCHCVGRLITTLGAFLHRLVLGEPLLPLGRRALPAFLYRLLDPYGVDRRLVLGVGCSTSCQADDNESDETFSHDTPPLVQRLRPGADISPPLAMPAKYIVSATVTSDP